MDFEKVIRLLDQFGVSVTLLMAGLVGGYLIAKRIVKFVVEVFRKMQARIDELEDQLYSLRDKFEEYLQKDNREIKQALLDNQRIQKETTTTLSNAIEIIKLNTEAYEKSRIVFEKVITFITETTKLIQQWMQK